MAQLGSDNSRYTNGEEVCNDLCWLNAQLNRRSPENLGATDHDPPLSAHVCLPASDVKVVGTINFKHHALATGQLPLGIEVTQPTVLISSFDLSVWFL